MKNNLTMDHHYNDYLHLKFTDDPRNERGINGIQLYNELNSLKHYLLKNCELALYSALIN